MIIPKHVCGKEYIIKKGDRLTIHHETISKSSKFYKNPNVFDPKRFIDKGVRKGCRYYTSDGKVFDADWNASINIAKKYSQKKSAKGVNHPILFSEPSDGSLNYMGRLMSTSQSCSTFS